MPRWSDLEEKAGENWEVKKGEALWINKDPLLLMKVFIKVPFNTLDPPRERINRALSNEDINLEAYFISDDVITYREAQTFAKSWVEMWGRMEEISLIDAPLPEFEEPTSLDFTPKMRNDFTKYKISSTSLAPLWGQHISYFKDIELELNSGPRQNNDRRVKYQQEWVSKHLYCPFCSHSDWNLTYAVSLRKPEQQWYDPSNSMYVLLCPKCERAVETIPKELIK